MPPEAAGLPLLLATADLQEAVGRLPEALAPLREAVRRSGPDPTPAVRLGRVLLLTGDVENEDTWDEAAQAYMDAIGKAPEDEGALAGLMYIAQRDYGRLWSRWRDARSSDRCRRVQEAMAAAPGDAITAASQQLLDYSMSLGIPAFYRAGQRKRRQGRRVLLAACFLLIIAAIMWAAREVAG